MHLPETRPGPRPAQGAAARQFVKFAANFRNMRALTFARP
jgi:hypothetical protein